MPVLEGLRGRLTKMGRPAPMRDFADYDDYWTRRITVGDTMPRWKIAAELIEDGATVLDVG